MAVAYGESFEGRPLRDIVAQLELCGFECEGGNLETNAAFIELKRRAEEEAK